MIGTLYIKQVQIGTVEFKVTDEIMGGIGGVLQPDEAYLTYQTIIQDLCDKNGIANIEDLHLSIVLTDNTRLEPEGAIGITDVAGIDEIYVETSGLDDEEMAKIAESIN